MPDITAANAILVLSAPDYLPAPQQIQGFSTDDIFSTTRTVPVETQLGVDGFYAAGFVFTEKTTEIMLNAASPSNEFFEQLNAGMETYIRAFALTGVLTLPALGKTAQLVQGYLTGIAPIGDAKRVLQPRRYEIKWQKIIIMPVGVNG